LRDKFCQAFLVRSELRILDPLISKVTLDMLGFREEDRKRLEKAVHSPMGTIFAGPSGSGKSTTMYSALQQEIHPEVTIYTVEDPVEHRMPGSTQVGVNHKAGITEAAVLRAFLRSDPDIIMVGNVPDLSTAELAMQAAITGHLVLALYTRSMLLALSSLF